MRVGLLGGSFDPVHYGHLRAAQWALDGFALDSVRLVPARQSPFKADCLASGEERYRMLSLATADNPSLGVEDCELHRAPPSYTVDTLRTLTLRQPDAVLVLIVGSDAAKDLETWREIAEIRKLAEIRVLGRPGEVEGGRPAEAVPFDGLAISSTAVRSAIRSGRSIRYLTPESVRLFIEEKGLYK
jgi:nicotinate-nucleotide adenylyltransferase